MDRNQSPLVVDIKRGSCEDGPGIRSVVFFKGCPLRCPWCHNPETQYPGAEIAFSARDCLQCGACVDACRRGAIDLTLPGHVNREKCNACGECARACPGKGLRRIGSYYTVAVLTEILLRDLPFYRHSGGGVTLSGGECTLFPDYLESLLRCLKAAGIHVAIETSGYFDYEEFSQKVLPYIDIIYYDIKIADPAVHRSRLGQTNHLILDNIRYLITDKRVEVHPRIPLVPGLTATTENLSSIINFLCKVGAGDVTLLPYNPMGLDMAINLGRPRPALPERFMTLDEEKEIRATFDMILKEHKKR